MEMADQRVHIFGKDITNLCNGGILGQTTTEIEFVTCARCLHLWKKTRQMVRLANAIRDEIGEVALDVLMHRIAKREAEL